MFATCLRLKCLNNCCSLAYASSLTFVCSHEFTQVTRIILYLRYECLSWVTFVPDSCSLQWAQMLSLYVLSLGTPALTHVISIKSSVSVLLLRDWYVTYPCHLWVVEGMRTYHSYHSPYRVSYLLMFFTSFICLILLSLYMHRSHCYFTYRSTALSHFCLS